MLNQDCLFVVNAALTTIINKYVKGRLATKLPLINPIVFAISIHPQTFQIVNETFRLFTDSRALLFVCFAEAHVQTQKHH